MPKRRNFQYDVVLSFAGEDRQYAEQLYEILKRENVNVFYDRAEQHLLWGKDLYQLLQEVYRDKAKYCVVFVSKNYSRKRWTKHGLRQAQERAFRENSEYILPIRLDQTRLPGLNLTTGVRRSERSWRARCRSAPAEQAREVSARRSGSRSAWLGRQICDLQGRFDGLLLAPTNTSGPEGEATPRR